MLLEAVDLTFAYGPQTRRRDVPTPVVSHVSLAIDHGALVGILGPNGSGKTTLLRLLAGTLAPKSGRVHWNGQDLRRLSRATFAKCCAVVPQNTQLAFEYTALEIALMGRYPHLGAFEVEGPDDLACALTALESTGTRDLANRSFQTLSGGEKQRVVIASALAQLAPTGRDRKTGARATSGSGRDGRLLLLDEPTASLDLRYQLEVARLIRRLHQEQDIAIGLSTHDVRFAASVCTEVLLLRDGAVLAHGPTADVLTAEALSALYDVPLDEEFAQAVGIHAW